jgi:hypothetical protein
MPAKCKVRRALHRASHGGIPDKHGARHATAILNPRPGHCAPGAQHASQAPPWGARRGRATSPAEARAPRPIARPQRRRQQHARGPLHRVGRVRVPRAELLGQLAAHVHLRAAAAVIPKSVGIYPTLHSNLGFVGLHMVPRARTMLRLNRGLLRQRQLPEEAVTLEGAAGRQPGARSAMLARAKRGRAGLGTRRQPASAAAAAHRRGQPARYATEPGLRRRSHARGAGWGPCIVTPAFAGRAAPRVRRAPRRTSASSRSGCGCGRPAQSTSARRTR